MKFTCESCGAQYMISDEKVGPSGVKVRCKKCGNVILVRRGTPANGTRPSAPNGSSTAPSIAMPAAAVPAESGLSDTAPSVAAPSAAAPQASGGGEARPAGSGLDAELGEAFDHAFGDTPPGTPAPGAQEPAAGQDMGATQLMSSEDAAKVFADRSAAAATSEWYVAIGQAQVGPLPLPEVKKKWEAGEVGPDSLVWRPGMADWAPLTTASELAGYLAPVPRPEARAQRAAEPRRAEALPRADLRAEPTPAPAPEPTWKPVGASALAALASEEIASREAPAPKPAQRPAQGAKSLVDALPDSGGVDPTGALPLNIKALEATTGEKKIERRSSVARGAAQVRHKSATRAVVLGVLAGAVVVAGAAGGYLYMTGKLVPQLPPSIAGAPAPRAPAVPPTASPPAPVPPATPAVQAPPAQPAVAAAPPPPSAAPAEAATKEAPREEAPAPAAKAERRSTNGAKRAEPARKEPARKEPTRVAAATPPPAPQPTSRKKGDLLDFESNDDALDAALGAGSGSSGRSVYVPPARANGLPDKVSPGDINAAVAQRIDSLRKCVAEQKAREPDASGTLKMRWVIQGDGNVRDVKCLTPEYAQGAFAQCIGGVVRTIKFPRSATTGQEVTFPFNF